MKTEHLLIDGDLILHRSLNIALTNVEFPDGEVHQVADTSVGNMRIDHEIARLKERFGARQVHVALSWEGERWRNRVLQDYKGRRPSVRPPGYTIMRRYMVDAHRALALPLLEGDDVLGLWATTQYREDHVLWTTDKDLLGVPCNLARGDAPPREVLPEDADYFHLFQALVGDRTDDYTGCPGVGVKTAEKVLRPLLPEERWPAVVHLYAKRTGADKDWAEVEALRQARVARILRRGEYDWERGAIRLWDPELRLTEEVL